MKNIYTLFATTLICCFGSFSSFAQCNPGEVELEIIIETDNYGYEGYWSLVKGNNNCGVNEIANGGNAQVGCAGGGQKNVTSGGYGNHQTFSAGKWCVQQDSLFDLHAIDDWGDGGFGYTVLANGYEILTVDGKSANETWSFYATLPPAKDAELNSLINPFSYSPSGNTNVKGIIVNKGTDTITTVEVNYALNGGTSVNTTITGISLGYNQKHTFTHPTAFNLNNGMHVIKVWTGNVNGGADSIHTNDTILMNFEVGPGIPNYIDAYIGSTPTNQVIASSVDGLNKPVDLDFHPILSNKELWVINKRTENTGGSTTTIWNAGTSSQYEMTRVDGNAWHFMSLPTGIAFGENENFGSSPGAFDANHNGGTPFTGPSLWSSDSSIYALPSGGNGSHLDMLHSSPKCQGIAHEVDNAYWVFDGHNNDIVRYDFKEDHGPGADYHGDAIVHRYRDHFVKMDFDEKVSSHLVVDKTTGWVYIVDFGNQRVMRLDSKSGTKGANSNINYYEQVAEYKEINNYTWETVVNSGLSKPSGIDIIEDRMIVSDYATGKIHIYNISAMPATQIGVINTGAAGIMGVKIGPEGRIWYADHDGNKVVKLEVADLSVNELQPIEFSLFPNPNNGNFKLRFTEKREVTVGVLNIVGQSIYKEVLNGTDLELNLNLIPGSYIAIINDGEQSVSKKIIVQ